MRTSSRPFVTTCLTLVFVLALVPTSDAEMTEETVVWEGSDRTISDDLTVANGTTLVIRGIVVTIEGSATITVEPEGRLVVESVPGSPTLLKSSGSGRWNLSASGAVELKGLPDAPVEIRDLGGAGTYVPGRPVLLSGGINVVRGTLVADHVVFRDYTSGVAVRNGDGRLTNVTFDSQTGVGLAVVQSGFSIENGTFLGMGGGIFATTTPTPATLRGLTFQDSPYAVRIRSSEVALDDISVDNASICLTLTGRAQATVRGLSCTDFRSAGVSLEPTVEKLRDGPSAIFEGLVASTTTTASPVAVRGSGNVTIRDSVLGPTGGHGVGVRENVMPIFENVTIRDVGGYAVVILTPVGPVPREMPPGLAPGAEGWFIASEYSRIRVVNATGDPVNHAFIELRHKANGSKVTDSVLETGLSPPILFTLVRIDRDGSVVDYAYRVRASDEQGMREVEVDLILDGSLFEVRLSEAATVAEEASPIPAPGILATLAALLLATRSLRGRRI